MNTLTIGEFTIRQTTDGLYCLNDLHRASGVGDNFKPGEWLKSADAQSYVRFLDEKSKCGNRHLEQNQHLTDEKSKVSPIGKYASSILRVIHGGDRRGTYACKNLVYKYAMWISHEFEYQVIEAFDRLVVSSANYDRRLLDWKKLNILEQPASWQKMFTEDYYTPIMRLFGWKFDGNHGRDGRGLPHVIGQITLEYVYRPICPKAVLDEIKVGTNGEKIHQWFQAGGRQMIAAQILVVIAMAKTSSCYDVFKTKCGVAFNNDPLQFELELHGQQNAPMRLVK